MAFGNAEIASTSAVIGTHVVPTHRVSNAMQAAPFGQSKEDDQPLWGAKWSVSWAFARSDEEYVCKWILYGRHAVGSKESQ